MAVSYLLALMFNNFSQLIISFSVILTAARSRYGHEVQGRVREWPEHPHTCFTHSPKHSKKKYHNVIEA